MTAQPFTLKLVGWLQWHIGNPASRQFTTIPPTAEAEKNGYCFKPVYEIDE